MALAVPTFVISAAPATIFKVEPCSSIAGLSAAKRASLATEKIDKCVNALGLLIASHEGCNCDNNLIQAANYAAQFIDTDNDGIADLLTSVASNIDSFDGETAKKPVLLCGKDGKDEEFSEDGDANDVLGPSFSCQAWKSLPQDGDPEMSAAATDAAVKPILKEEAFHLMQQYVNPSCESDVAPTHPCNCTPCSFVHYSVVGGVTCNGTLKHIPL
jgi:hypothetical protein